MFLPGQINPNIQNKPQSCSTPWPFLWDSLWLQLLHLFLLLYITHSIPLCFLLSLLQISMKSASPCPCSIFFSASNSPFVFWECLFILNLIMFVCNYILLLPWSHLILDEKIIYYPSLLPYLTMQHLRMGLLWNSFLENIFWTEICYHKGGHYFITSLKESSGM